MGKLNPWALSRYRVRLHIDHLVGGIPRDPTIIASWLAGRGVKTNVEAVAKAEAEDIMAAQERSWKGFKQDSVGVYIEDRNIKGLLKQAARALEMSKKKVDKEHVYIPAVLKKVSDNLLVEPRKIYPTRNLKKFQSPDGSEERAVHAMTAQGPRTGLKRSDYLDDVELEFFLSPSHADLTQRVLHSLVEYASFYLGIGSDVSQGDGKFQLVAFDKL